VVDRKISGKTNRLYYKRLRFFCQCFGTKKAPFLRFFLLRKQREKKGERTARPSAMHIVIFTELCGMGALCRREYALCPRAGREGCPCKKPCSFRYRKKQNAPFPAKLGRLSVCKKGVLLEKRARRVFLLVLSRPTDLHVGKQGRKIIARDDVFAVDVERKGCLLADAFAHDSQI